MFVVSSTALSQIEMEEEASICLAWKFRFEREVSHPDGQTGGRGVSSMYGQAVPGTLGVLVMGATGAQCGAMASQPASLPSLLSNPRHSVHQVLFRIGWRTT